MSTRRRRGEWDLLDTLVMLGICLLLAAVVENLDRIATSMDINAKIKVPTVLPQPAMRAMDRIADREPVERSN